ncbi:5'-3' exonuclease PLD3 isoform X2 [Centropristis striata]|uniref:5'-3' exonuclease PLD3 isoform X2 n=1 Tax=Centropristis striata TaxID=184440 RepID=UPI0027E002D1|nr:5'-3' exonuclease PLD3 isoform X2 [Centropristis striata]
MPMVLRNRKSIHPREVESLDTTPATPRRSTRLHGGATYEESDESDSETVQGQVMEEHQSPQAADVEEDTAEESGVTDLKYCSVVLDRFDAEEKLARKELEEKEDMNRKGGKPVSRIPTFHKRPIGAGQTPELPVPRKDSPVSAQPPERAGSGSVEASKSKPPDVRETALPLPSVRVPKLLFEAPSPFSGTEEAAAAAHSPLITAPKSLSESMQFSSMTASPRPALRPQPGSQQHAPEQDQSRTYEIEADTVQDAPISHLEGSVSQKQLEETEKYGVEPEGSILLVASGDNEKTESADVPHTAEVSQEEAIMDEQPPWETEPMNILDYKDSRSSSDVECEDSLPDEKSEGCDSEEVQEQHVPLVSQSQVSDVAEDEAIVEDASPPERPVKAPSSKSTKSSGCSSFALFFFLPTTLLLLGGFGQHVWHYGLPLSVVQLTAQMELHWLEGFGLVPEPCTTDCRVRLVESIPEGLYQSSPSSRQSIADSWLHLLDKANHSVNIAAFYFTLRDGEVAHSSDSQGRMVFEQLKQLQSKGVKLQIAVNAPQTSTQDTKELAATGAEVREVDLKAVTGGIVHTKLWVVDQKHLYLGSANMDWRSLTQVKEVGLSVEDCSCLAQDAFRIFGVYWSIGGANNGSLPPYWPARLSALSSSHNPLRLKFNGVPAQVYLSSAPPQISARGRSDDLSTILSVINDAQKLIYISVMDFLPLSQFTEPLRFWPAIDSALRAAACTRRVQVRLLVSCWKHSPAAMFPFLQSLLVLNRPHLECDIEVKIFTVPSTAQQMKIPFARVNHAKYMVTDRVVYIGTSNWSQNYFTQTAGVGLVVNQTGSKVQKGQETLQSQAEDLFLRDWTSQYASTLSVDDMDVCPRGPH